MQQNYASFQLHTFSCLHFKICTLTYLHFISLKCLISLENVQICEVRCVSTCKSPRRQEKAAFIEPAKFNEIPFQSNIQVANLGTLRCCDAVGRVID